MKKSWIYAIILSPFLWAACDDDDNDNADRSLNDTDEAFVENAAMANLKEIELGELASTQGHDSLVRAYGQQMVAEHTVAQNELRVLSQNYDGVDWPEALPDADEQMRAQLTELDSTAFDSAYMASQVADHQRTIDLFEAEIDNGEEEPVKNYASKYLPHVEMHLERADSIYTVIIQNPDDMD